MSAPIRGVLYARMSSNDQDGSIEQQQAWAGDACPKAGIDVLAEFIDSAKKGHDTARRTDFQRMLDFCQTAHHRRQPIDAIVCWHSNRFSRSDSVETSWFIHEFRKAGVHRMLTASGWIDFRRMQDRILFGINQDASNNAMAVQLGRDALRGKRAPAEAGYFCGGPVPIGYRLQVCEGVAAKGKKKTHQRLVIDPQWAPFVRQLFEEYATGRTSLYQLAQRLNADGIPTPRAIQEHEKAGGRWYPGGISSILRNETYLGGGLIWNRSCAGSSSGLLAVRLSSVRASACERTPRPT